MCLLDVTLWQGTAATPTSPLSLPTPPALEAPSRGAVGSTEGILTPLTARSREHAGPGAQGEHACPCECTCVHTHVPRGELLSLVLRTLSCFRCLGKEAGAGRLRCGVPSPLWCLGTQGEVCRNPCLSRPRVGVAATLGSGLAPTPGVRHTVQSGLHSNCFGPGVRALSQRLSRAGARGGGGRVGRKVAGAGAALHQSILTYQNWRRRLGPWGLCTQCQVRA